jgi:hypothetical protein
MPEELTDQEKILEGEWANCWVCAKVFQRKRETKRYCSVCHQGWCEGEHGNFAYGVGKCIVCGLHKKDKPA